MAKRKTMLNFTPGLLFKQPAMYPRAICRNKNY